MTTRVDGHSRCDHMAHPFLGLLFAGLVIKTIFVAAIVIALVWLIFKLGRLADAYTKKLK